VQHYDLLVLAGETAAEFAARPLDAVDFYEQAISLDPARTEAYTGQFQLLSGARRFRPVADLYERQGAASLQMDSKVWRDFDRLSPEKQTSHELDMADYLLWRCTFPLWDRELDAAVAFIHRRLFNARGEFQGWKVGLNLAYAQALFMQSLRVGREAATSDSARQRGCERLNAAVSQLNLTQSWLNHLISQQHLDPRDVLDYGETLDDLTVRFHELKQVWRCS